MQPNSHATKLACNQTRMQPNSHATKIACLALCFLCPPPLLTPRDRYTLCLPARSYCIGKTKVFFKGSELPGLETRRLALATRRALQLQAHARRLIAARFYYRAKAAVPKIQAAARRRAARKLLAHLRKVKSDRLRGATCIQSYARMVSRRRRYARMQVATLVVQKNTRMRLRRRVFAETLERARAQATYEGQLKEARQRLEREASEREILATEKARLEDKLKASSKSSAEAALAAQERRNQAQE